MYNLIVSGGYGNKNNRHGKWNIMEERVAILKSRPLSMIHFPCMDWLENLE
jgi:hypothetical protein